MSMPPPPFPPPAPAPPPSPGSASLGCEDPGACVYFDVSDREILTSLGIFAFLAGCLLLLFGVRLVHSAQQNAFTTDEPNYLGTGLYLWESGDYHFFRSLRFSLSILVRTTSAGMPSSAR